MNRLLLIDDDIEILRMLKLSLEYSGFEVMIAGDTISAGDLIETFSFDLVVCDLTMPRESGYEFKERMMLRDLTLPPFLFCSGVPDFQIPHHIAEGVVGFLPKPLTIPELVNTIRMVSAKGEYRGEGRSFPDFTLNREASAMLFHDLATDK